MKKMYYVQDYYTKEIFKVFENVKQAIELSKTILDSEVRDENNEFYYFNVDLPF